MPVNTFSAFCAGVLRGPRAVVLLSLILMLSLILIVAATGCGVSGTDDEYECDQPSPPGPGAVMSGDALAVAGESGHTTTMAIVDTTHADGSRVVEIEWLPAYVITNLTGDEICVRDVRVDFPENRDPNTGRLLALNSNGGSRLVEIYNDSESILKAAPTVKRQPPFGLGPGENVLVRFHQYFTLTADGVPVSLRVSDDLSQHLGPLFVGLPQSPDGRYQCVPSYSGLRVVVESNLGEATIETVNAIMPVGCYLNIPPR